MIKKQFIRIKLINPYFYYKFRVLKVYTGYSMGKD